MTDLEPALEERLRALRGSDPRGDWLDVRRRARRPRRRVLALAAAAAALIALPAIAFGGGLLDVLGITASPEPVPRPARASAKVPPFVHGNALFGLRGGPRRLAASLFAPLLGQAEALAVPTRNGRYVVYHAWDGAVRGDGTPVLRVHDARTGGDVVLARGAQSVAVHADGRVAYTKASRPRYASSAEGTLGGRFGHVLVAASLAAPPERWTEEAGEYVVHAWAGATLLVQARPGPGYLLPASKAGPAPGVYALTSRGRMHRLPITGVVAVSPDGRRALGWWMRGDGPPRGSRLVDVESGRILASSALPLTRGAWHGDRVVAPIGPGARRLAVLRIGERSIVVERKLALADDPRLASAYGPFLGRPVFVDGDRAVVIAVSSVTRNERASFVGFLTCDLGDRNCVRGRDLRPATTWAAVLENPSRP